MKKLLFLLLVLPFIAKTQCININSAIFTNPSGDNVTWSLVVGWTAQGTKHLNIVVLNSGDTAFTTCLQINSPSTTSGTSTYDGIITPGGCSGLSAIFTKHNGLCGTDNRCGSDQAIWNGTVLNVKFAWVTARNINNYTVVKFKVGDIEGKKEVTLNFTLKNGITKKHLIKFPNYIHPNDIWEVIIDNTNNTYSLKKLW